jgi:dihydroorotase
MRMVDLFTSGPARVLGLERTIAPGQPADLTILSLKREWTFRASESASKSRNSPFDGQSFKGGPVATVVGGRVVQQ